MPEVYDIIIIGGGPAGLGAALYGARGLHSTLIVERATPGGLLRYAGAVDDYPGIPAGISGPDLGKAMWDQCTKFGAETVTAEAMSVEVAADLKVVHTSRGDYTAKTVILAAGSVPNILSVPGAQELQGKGVYGFETTGFSAVAGKPVVVVGGGDTALTRAIAAAEHASHVTIVHRGSSLRAFEVFQQAVEANPKITLLTNTTVQAILGEGAVNAVRVQNGAGPAQAILAAAVILAIGFQPNTSLYGGVLPLLPTGHVAVDEWMATSLPGVFAAGDVRSNTYRQAISAAGDGCTAAIAADHYLQNAH